MRDDVKTLFAELQQHLELKKKFLNTLLENEKSASDLVKNRNDAEDDILKIIEKQAALIDEINVKDYYISMIKDDITRRYDFDFNKVFRSDYFSSEKEIMDFRTEVLIHLQIISSIIDLKKTNNHLMNKNQQDLEVQILELERMGKLQIIYPKDLQSS